MADLRSIRTALLSVYHKDDSLRELIDLLAKDGVKLLSTGGTKTYIDSPFLTLLTF